MIVAQASFGPFYRIEQLILTSAWASGSGARAQSGRAPIVTDANIQLLFDMQVGHITCSNYCCSFEPVESLRGAHGFRIESQHRLRMSALRNKLSRCVRVCMMEYDLVCNQASEAFWAHSASLHVLVLSG